jgi:hypothetical protein
MNSDTERVVRFKEARIPYDRATVKRLMRACLTSEPQWVEDAWYFVVTYNVYDEGQGEMILVEWVECPEQKPPPAG